MAENAELLYTDSQYKYYKVTVTSGTRMVSGKVTETCEAAGMEAVCSGPDTSCTHYNEDMCTITPLSTKCNYPT